MTLKNVSLVFGPTLVRNPNPPSGLIVNDINAGNSVVEMLCQHVSWLVSAFMATGLLSFATCM